MKRLESRVKELELDNLDLNTRLTAVSKENNKRGDDNAVTLTLCRMPVRPVRHKFFIFHLKNLKTLLADSEKQLQKVKKTLEEETLARVDLENKNQSLKEELQFKSQLYDKVSRTS